MYGETHAVDGALDISIGSTTQLARCYVRFDNKRISETPTCKWCRQQLVDRGVLLTADDYNAAIMENVAALSRLLDRRLTTQ